MAEPAILVIDQGTTGTGVCVVDAQGSIVASADHEFTQYFPQPGWVEHDAEEIWRTVQNGIEQMLQATRGHFSATAVGLTNQRETVVVWSRLTGEPIAHAIVWQDRRTAGQCEALRAAGHEPMIRERTGLVLDPYFSATKIAWLLDNVPSARHRANQGELLAGTIDAWLIWKLTGGTVHVTDRTNASRTSLYNLRTEAWDAELCELFAVPPQVLPQVVPSSGVIATTDPSQCGGLTVPIAGVAGDQQSALFGQTCFAPGTAKNTFGTGCFLLVQTGNELIAPQQRVLATAAVAIDASGGAIPSYALEGSVFVAGAAVQWLRDQLGLIRTAAESEPVAASVPDTGGVFVVPAFTGLGAPYWDPYARGTIVGLTRGTSRAHIVRATLESIAFQTCDLVRAIADEGAVLTELRVDGGASTNDLLMQMQADLLGIPVQRGTVAETTSLGAAFLAGLATGAWHSAHELTATWKLDRTFEPRISAHEREARYAGWQRAVQRSRLWTQPVG